MLLSVKEKQSTLVFFFRYPITVKVHKQCQQECKLLQGIGFLKYLFSLTWSNKLSTVYFHSIQLAHLFEGHWAECGIVFFLSIKLKKIINIFKSD